MNKSIINGIEITGNYKSISINNGKIYLDGKLYQPEGKKEYCFNGPLIINGNVKGDVDGTIITINGDVGGDVDGTNIIIEGSVSGDVDGTQVTVKNLGV